MIKYVAEIKKWDVEEDWGENDEQPDDRRWGVVRRLEENWKKFKAGNHYPHTRKSSNKNRKVYEIMKQ